ncbi:hypothetical protein HF521_001251 [Silurus meridionalis]|uniref:Uncharacterized protein n=1 Tax=Silurus meridionalis TaxID=175797 RepID=A0A8T0BAN9_SILME|nr:hypothetical protein HF521_001251 [Silurus meridionalis]
MWKSNKAIDAWDNVAVVIFRIFMVLVIFDMYIHDRTGTTANNLGALSEGRTHAHRPAPDQNTIAGWEHHARSNTASHTDSQRIARRVQVTNGKGEWPLIICLIPNLPVPLLLGKDWPGFPNQ